MKSGTTGRTRYAVIAAAMTTLATGSLASAVTFNLGLGIRETGGTVAIGGNGGTTGGIEFVGYKPEPAPIVPGHALVADGSWQTITFTFGSEPVFGFAGATANGVLDGTRGVLEHIGFQNTAGSTDRIAFFIDDLTNTVGGVPTVIEDFESRTAVATPSAGPEVIFRRPRFSGSTQAYLSTSTDTANVTAESAGGGLNSYRLGFQFATGDANRWVRLTTNGSPTLPNPAIDFSPGSTLSFKARAIVIPEISGWNVDANGNWTDPANWAGGVPNANNAIARFGGAIAITQPRTVTVDQTVTAGSIVFKSPVSYTINPLDASTGILLRASVGFDVLLSSEQGSHTINAGMEAQQRVAVNVANAADTLTIGNLITFDYTLGGTTTGTNYQETVNLVKQGAGKAVINPLKMNVVTVSTGTLQLAAGSGASDVNQLDIAGASATPSAKLDITNNGVVINYTGASPLITQRNRIAAGYHGGLNDGNGIVSSSLDATTAIGYAEASAIGLGGAGSTFMGIPVDADTVVIRVTKRGDANLDAIVNFNDLVSLAQNYAPGYDPVANGPKLWSQGDFDYTGIVDFADLVALAQNYGKSLTSEQASLLGADFAADFALAQSLVPEPTSMLAAGSLALLAASRRRAAR